MRRIAVALSIVAVFVDLHPQSIPATGVTTGAEEGSEKITDTLADIKAEISYERALSLIDKAVVELGKEASAPFLEEKASLLMLHLDFAMAAKVYVDAAEASEGLEAARLLCASTKASIAAGLTQQAKSYSDKALALASRLGSAGAGLADEARLLNAIAGFHEDPSSTEAIEALETLATRISADARSVDTRALASYYALVCSSGMPDKALPEHSTPFPIMIRASGRTTAPSQAGPALVRESYTGALATSAPKKEVPHIEVMYRFQVGAFSRAKNAEEARDSLRAKGFDARVVETGGLFKVIVHSSTQDAASQLRKAGFDSFPLPSGSP